MDFALSDDQEMLRDLAARILSENCTDEFLKAFNRDDRDYDEGLWRKLADAGLLGIALPERQGGMNLGLVELGLLLEEQGRTLAPLPIQPTLVMAALPIAEFGSDEQRKILPRVATGEAILTAALEEVGNPDPACPVLRATRASDGWVLEGVKVAVPYGLHAEKIIVPAMSEEGVVVFLLDPAMAGISRVRQQSTSSEPQAQITFSGTRVDRTDVLGTAERGGEIVAWIVDRARAALAAVQVGICEEALKRTAAYTRERIQFGLPVAMRQAVQHRIADGFIDIQAMRYTALKAMWQLDLGKNAAAEVETAKYWAASGGFRVSHTAQHLHGGIGSDLDYPIHRFFLAAKQVEIALGGAQPMLGLIGRAIADGKTQQLAGVE